MSNWETILEESIKKLNEEAGIKKEQEGEITRSNYIWSTSAPVYYGSKSDLGNSEGMAKAFYDAGAYIASTDPYKVEVMNPSPVIHAKPAPTKKLPKLKTRYGVFYRKMKRWDGKLEWQIYDKADMMGNLETFLTEFFSLNNAISRFKKNING